MLPLAGYADRLSARPGETLNFKLSNATGEAVEAALVRVVSADANPAGRGVLEERLPIELPRLDVGHYDVPRGSWGEVVLGDALNGAGAVTLCFSLRPTQRPMRGAALVLAFGEGEDTSVAIVLRPDGRLAMGDAVTGDALPEGEWADVALIVDPLNTRIQLMVRPVRGGAAWSSAAADGTLAQLPGERGRMLLAGDPGGRYDHFDGCIENPTAYPAVLSADEIDLAFSDGNGTGGGTGAALPQPLFAFDFAEEAGGQVVIDKSVTGLRGQLHNHPVRAMRGSRWSGREMCFRHAPAEYGAIHFHSDDMTDCRWPTALSWQVPDDLASGCYALRIKAGEAEDNVPFFIVPPKGRATARIAVLVSTFTYTVYANHARPEYLLSSRWRNAWHEQTAAWSAYPHNPGDHPEYAWSTYNNHSDGSGISISSWHRPMLNVRVGYITYPFEDIRASGLRHYPADTHLHTWLEEQGYAFDVITDQELHEEGLDLLRDYTVVLTGSHPEYHTRDMLDALTAYRDHGGRLMYLGGNGFYWKVALDPARDGIIEIRRGEGGIRAWAAEPGEYYNQFDGEYGGLWRRNGRPPQDLVGVGFSAQGNFVGSHYTVDEAGRQSRAGWMLEGLGEPEIGGHGLSGHGAAGFELDRADKALGTPRHAVVLATSEGHEPEAPWVLVPEERLTHLTTLPGKSDPELIHADMVFFETPMDGAVFSTGSITYCGSLLTNGGDNDISRLTRNVLDRFSDPEASFPMPDAAEG